MPPFGGRRPEHAKSTDTAVRKDVQPDVGGDGIRPQLGREAMKMIGLERCARQNDLPVAGDSGRQVRRDAAGQLFDHGGFEGKALGIVALEVSCVELDAGDRPLGAKPNHDPVVSGSAPTFRLPALACVRGSVGHQHVGRFAKESIAGVDDVGAVGDRGQIHGGVRRDTSPVWQGLAQHPQSGHTTVWENVETKVRDPLRALHSEDVFRVTAQLAMADERSPLERGRIGLLPGSGDVDGTVRWKISPKERRVDHDRANDVRADPA